MKARNSLKEYTVPMQAGAAQEVGKAGELQAASRKVIRSSEKKATSQSHARPFVSLLPGVAAGWP